MEKTWEKWAPISPLEADYDFVETIEDGDLTIVIASETHTLKLVFDGFVFGHRRLRNDCGIKKPCNNWSFYTTQHASFFNWMLKENGSVHAYPTLTQYSIFTNECIIEVVVADRSMESMFVIKQ